MTKSEAIRVLEEHLEHWERLKTERIAPKEEGERTVEAFRMAIETLSEPSGDLISRADAVKCVGWGDSVTEVINRIKSLPSAEVEPTVIRSRTLMPTKDFMEWAKRIKETNPNAIVIPCDAEIVSAEAEWIPCSERLPRTGNDILVTFSDGEVDIIISARPKAWVKYEEANNLIFPVAWMPLPKPYKGGEEENEEV